MLPQHLGMIFERRQPLVLPALACFSLSDPQAKIVWPALNSSEMIWEAIAQEIANPQMGARSSRPHPAMT